MQLDLADRTYLMTGGGSGSGKAWRKAWPAPAPTS